MISLIRGTKRSQLHRDRKENGGCQGLGERERGVAFLAGTEFQFCETTRILWMDGDTPAVAQQ